MYVNLFCNSTCSRIDRSISYIFLNSLFLSFFLSFFLTLYSYSYSLPPFLIASHLPPLLSALSSLSSSSNLSGLDNALRRKIFSFYISTSDLTSAGNALGSLRIDNYIGDPSDPYSFTPPEACDVYIQVAECFLEEDEAASAETFVGKAKMQKADIGEREASEIKEGR